MGSLRRLAPGVAVLAGPALLPAAADAYPAPNDPFLPSKSVLVSMEITGGIAGIDDFLAVGSDGAGKLDTRQGTGRFKLSKRRLKDLRARLSAARWLRLKSEYPSPGGTADAFSYSILYHGHDVRTGDGAHRPARLQRVLSALQRIRSEHG